MYCNAQSVSFFCWNEFQKKYRTDDNCILITLQMSSGRQCLHVGILVCVHPDQRGYVHFNKVHWARNPVHMYVAWKLAWILDSAVHHFAGLRGLKYIGSEIPSSIGYPLFPCQVRMQFVFMLRCADCADKQLYSGQKQKNLEYISLELPLLKFKSFCVQSTLRTV